MRAASYGKRLLGLRCGSRGAHFAPRQMNVTICALVQWASGLNVVALVPVVMPFFTAQRTASA